MSKITLKQTRLTILLSLNAVAIVIAGLSIASAIWFGGGFNFRAVGERSDIINDNLGEMTLLESAIAEAPVATEIPAEYQGTMGGYSYSTQPSYEFSSKAVPTGEIWNETAITMYATPDIDICVGGGLSNLGDLYWQTSDTSIIAGFYNSARTWLGYSSDTCRYPVIVGTGTVTITAGTYDGTRKDSLTVTVIAPPAEQWKREVLSLVNNIRANNSLAPLAWGSACEFAADTRADEIKTYYNHTRPDGTSWATACPAPDSGGTSGENLAVGNAAVSPVTVVMLWMGSESHRENILNASFTKLAVGFNYDPNTQYKTHWSQFFSTY